MLHRQPFSPKKAKEVIERFNNTTFTGVSGNRVTFEATDFAANGVQRELKKYGYLVKRDYSAPNKFYYDRTNRKYRA